MRTTRLLLALLALAVPAALSAHPAHPANPAQLRVGVAITIAPHVIPVYEQPLCPGDGYLWTPGYWAWDDSVGDYYWVPGTWIMAPEVGFLWTPGWWGWRDNGFFWNEGFWGPTVGFYGGIDYGFGYFGVGFEGGRWDHGHFFYNRAVMNVNVTEIHNVYNDTTIIHENNVRTSFNGGNGGLTARPRPEEEAAARERHIAPVEAQTQHAATARGNPQLRASANHGNPPIAATAKAGDFSEHSAVGARGAENAHAGAEPSNAVHPHDLPAIDHPAPANSGDTKADSKYQKQQDKLIANQQKERDKLQQKQEAEHQKQMNDTQKQQLEQKHRTANQGSADAPRSAATAVANPHAPAPRSSPAT